MVVVQFDRGPITTLVNGSGIQFITISSRTRFLPPLAETDVVGKLLGISRGIMTVQQRVTRKQNGNAD